MDASRLLAEADKLGRDKFIEHMEQTWNGVFLPLETARRLGVAIMDGAYDYSIAADPEGAEHWIEQLIPEFLYRRFNHEE